MAAPPAAIVSGRDVVPVISTQGFPKLTQVVRKRTREMERLAGSRMGESEFCRVQCQAGGATHVRKVGVAARGPAVDGITTERMT